MMNSLSQSAAQPAESQSVKEPVITDIDEGCEQKITDKRQAVLDAILNERPRFVVAFERMKVCGNIIEVEVPSQTLYEEIMRSKTEILLLIARTAGVNGTMDLKINVNEVVRAARPIKLEDRIRHMNEKNPMLLELKKVLDMEYE